MSCLTEEATMWYLTGDNTGRGPKFSDPVSGMSTKQFSLGLVQSDTGKDYDNTTVIQTNIKPKNGAYVAIGSYTGNMPPDSALQIKRFVQDYFDSSLWEVHLD